MDEKLSHEIHNHFEKDSNCQVFNGPVSGCVFAMPGATVNQSPVQRMETERDERPEEGNGLVNVLDEELCHFVHPSVNSQQEWQVHNEIKRLVARQGIQEICRHLQQMRKDNKVLLPQSPSSAYTELVRMGMPNGEGFNENTFRKYYSSK